MWRKSLTFLVVLALVVSSLSAYPAFFYGKAKATVEEKTEEALVLPEETSSEAQTKSSLDLISSEETPIIAEEASAKTEEYDDTKSVVALLEEAKVKKSVIDKVKEACFLIDEGRTEMVIAYNAEVEAHEETRALLDKPRYVIMPLASYTPSTLAWGAGLALGVEYKGIAMQVQAIKPITAGLDSFKQWDDLTIIAGVGIYF